MSRSGESIPRELNGGDSIGRRLYTVKSRQIPREGEMTRAQCNATPLQSL